MKQWDRRCANPLCRETFRATVSHLCPACRRQWHRGVWWGGLACAVAYKMIALMVASV